MPGIMREPDEGIPVAEETTLDAFATEERSPRVETTMVWRPEGATCASCGATAPRLWRAAAGLVCPECKPWTDE